MRDQSSDVAHDGTGKPGRETFAVWMRAIADAGDRQAFGEVFAYFAPRVKSYLLRLGANDHQAEDLTQDVMLLVWRRAGQFDPAQASLSTWIFTIARNRRIDVLRRERRPEFDPEDPALVRDADPQPDARVEADQKHALLREAIDDLPEEQAHLLRLNFFEELPHSAIADRLGLPLGTVKSRLRLAMSRMRKALGELE
jgi:RNA polymerase sigma-70 factor (ECF subfamily)